MASVRDLLPYFCPRCGDHARFPSVAELRCHLVGRHTYETLLVLSQARARSSSTSSSSPGALLPLLGRPAAQGESPVLGSDPRRRRLPLALACLDLASSSASSRLLREGFTREEEEEEEPGCCLPSEEQHPPGRPLLPGPARGPGASVFRTQPGAPPRGARPDKKPGAGVCAGPGVGGEAGAGRGQDAGGGGGEGGAARGAPAGGAGAAGGGAGEGEAGGREAGEGEGGGGGEGGLPGQAGEDRRGDDGRPEERPGGEGERAAQNTAVSI